MHSAKATEEIHKCNIFMYLKLLNKIHWRKKRDTFGECNIKEDVASRIKKANGVFVQLYPVWRNHNISKGVKIRIFNTNVKSVLL
jgi:hypothetical protein